MSSDSQKNTTLTILIADEEEASRSFIINALKDLSHHTDTASTSKKALSMLEKATYDLLIFDTWSQEMPGLSLYEKAGESNEFIEGIIVTGAASIYGVLDAYRSGIFDFIQKPLENPEKIVQAVKGVSQKRTYWLNLMHTLDHQMQRI